MGLVTGCFSLVGIQEVISYEYIYKLTQYNVVPDTPVSSNAEGSVPEGWSSQLLGVSASLPYLWESRRQKKDSYVTRDLSSSSFTRNYWIGTNGVASYSNGYSYSEVFDLPSGQTIEVLTAGTGFSVIARHTNGIYNSLVNANGSVSEQKMYTYTADTDCQIVVSVYHLSSYSVKITSGTWSAWSTPTLKSSWGKQGAKMRMRTWSSDTEYLSGADGEDFYDVVIYLEKLYLCTKTHTSKSGTNDPVTSISGYLGYWESAQDWTFVATKLLLAEKISAEQIDADGLVAKNVDVTGKITATSGTFSNCVFNSLRSSDNSFVYDSNGLSISAEFSITAGNYTLKLEKQYADFLITDKSGRSLVRLAAFDDIQVASPSLRLSHPTSGNSAELNVSSLKLGNASGEFVSLSTTALQFRKGGTIYDGRTGSTTFYDSNGNGTRMYFYCGILYKIVSV